MWSEDIAKEISALGQRAIIGKRSWLAFGVGLDKVACKVWNLVVDLACDVFLPGDNGWLKRIERR